MAVTTAAAILGASALGVGGSAIAANKQASATKTGLAQSKALSEQSRRDAIQLYNQGRVSGRKGLESAFDYYKQATQTRTAPLTASNVAAQRVIGQGAQQATNAILGKPVDWSFTAPQQVNPDYSVIQNAQLPAAAGEYLPQEQQSPEQVIQANTLAKGRGLIR